MTLADLRLTKADAKEEKAEIAASPYMAGSVPWGLCIRLEKRELDKLGVKSMPNAGDQWRVTAVGRITQVTQSTSTDSDDSRTVALSIEMMEVQAEEPAAMEKADGKQRVAKEQAERKGLLGRY